MTIHLHIERVVLEGLPIAREPQSFRGALQGELTRLLRSGGTADELRNGGAVPQIQGGRIRVGARMQGGSLGTQVAGAIYRGVGSGRGERR